jgi:uncharacterized protein YbjQ (UPF0145 family)
MSDTESQAAGEGAAQGGSELEAGRRTVIEAFTTVASGHVRPGKGGDRPVTSDLTIDEALILHSVGWEPIELVCGAAVYPVPQGSWQWSPVGEIAAASQAHTNAVAMAANRIERECGQVGGYGVVGVFIEIAIERHHINVVLTGAAVAPTGAPPRVGAPFVSDLSSRDFALLLNAGWEPMGLAFGASFVHAPRRSAGTALQQKTQNVELTTFTEALYSARESAMERMQSSALALSGTGVVAVQVSEGPMSFANHAIAFTAWGTAVRLGPAGHQHMQPRVVLPVDDAGIAFAAEALRGA